MTLTYVTEAYDHACALTAKTDVLLGRRAAIVPVAALGNIASASLFSHRSISPLLGGPRRSLGFP
jgi:hypothetical protein